MHYFTHSTNSHAIAAVQPFRVYFLFFFNVNKSPLDISLAYLHFTGTIFLFFDFSCVCRMALNWICRLNAQTVSATKPVNQTERKRDETTVKWSNRVLLIYVYVLLTQEMLNTNLFRQAKWLLPHIQQKSIKKNHFSAFWYRFLSLSLCMYGELYSQIKYELNAQHPFVLLSVNVSANLCLQYKFSEMMQNSVCQAVEHFINKCDLYVAACVLSLVESESTVSNRKLYICVYIQNSLSLLVLCYSILLSWKHTEHLVSLRITTHTCQGFIVIVCWTNSCYFSLALHVIYSQKLWCS